MIELKDIKKLAGLARIDMKEEEMEGLRGDIESILGYVDQIKKAGSAAPKQAADPVRNVMREDAGAHEPGVHTEALLNEAPAREGNYLRVKKIL